MLMPLLARMLPRTLIAAAVLCAVAAPAGAKVVYRWKTDDGVYAFTDDAKRIPERYRAQAKAAPLRPLHAYKSYTPAQRSGTQAHARRMEKSAEEMSKLNARVSGAGTLAPGTIYGSSWGSDAAIVVGSGGQSAVAIGSGAADSGEPIVIEKRRFYVPGTQSTRTDTIMRQGGRIITVVKPIAHESDIAEIPSEAELPE